MLIIYYVPMQRQAAKLTSVTPGSIVEGKVIQRFEPRTSEDNSFPFAAHLPRDLSLNLLPSPKGDQCHHGHHRLGFKMFQ